MSNWTIQNKSVTGETQWTNASFDLSFVLLNNTTGQTDFIDVAGYTSGTISFTISPDPSDGTWAPLSTLEISIIGAIDGTVAAPVSSFTVQTLEIKNTDSGTTFYVEWNIPLQFVSLLIDNNTTSSTGITINVTNIRLQTESEGGGVGFTSSSGATIGPGGTTPQMQFNDGGIFGGTKNVLYDKTANIQPPVVGIAQGQVQLGDTTGFPTGGTDTEPILAFADATGYGTGLFNWAAGSIGISCSGVLEAAITDGFHISALGGTASRPAFNFMIPPTANGNTGMYSTVLHAVEFAGAGIEQASIHSVPAPSFIKGLNVGTTTNVTGIQRLSINSNNSWEDGNCGNAQFLVFTASDFSNIEYGRTGLLVAINQFVIFNSTTAIPLIPVAPSGGIMDIASGIGGGQNANTLTAIKLLPKGFRVPSGENATCFCGGTGFPALTAGRISQVDMTGGSAVPFFLANNTVGSGGSFLIPTHTNSSAGNGLMQIMVQLRITQGSQLAFGNPLVGIQVPIERI